uniref:Ig-like domain-containing protein n=1 Tax=Xiphophorus maculatus TaxID=8083 RepID=A0A3B5Q233_XIPMA
MFSTLAVFLLLLFSAVTKQSSSSVIVRGGDEVVLACENMMGPIKCLRIHWLFSKLSQGTALTLVKFGHPNQTQAAREKADRLRVSSNCSLIIQKVSAADVGTYYCQQVQEQMELIHTVALSLVNSDHQLTSDDEEVTLNCSVIPNDPCKHNVKWLYQGQNIDKHNTNLETKYSLCAAEVTFKSLHYVYEPGRYNSLQCAVEDCYIKNE